MRAPWDKAKPLQLARRICESVIRRFDQGASSWSCRGIGAVLQDSLDYDDSAPDLPMMRTKPQRNSFAAASVFA
jgi:hypothetical protein